MLHESAVYLNAVLSAPEIGFTFIAAYKTPKENYLIKLMLLKLLSHTGSGVIPF